MSLVSIITPAYNCIKTIKLTYESILSQTFTDWEWIVVDDCSKDSSFSYITEMVKMEKQLYSQNWFLFKKSNCINI